MKQISMLALILVWLLAGCSYSSTDLSKSIPLETQSVSEEKTVSKEDVIQIFTNVKDHKDCIVTDCVVAEDSAYGLGNGTVQLSLISRETGIVYDYMVEYSCEGADSNFKVTSTERSQCAIPSASTTAEIPSKGGEDNICLVFVFDKYKNKME